MSLFQRKHGSGLSRRDVPKSVLAAILFFGSRRRALAAAEMPVLVSDTLYLQQANGWNGEITVSWPAFTAFGGTQVAKGSRTYTITDGVISIALYSNAPPAAPSIVYTARYRSTDAANSGLTWTETWHVPMTGPVSLDAVRPRSFAVEASNPTWGNVIGTWGGQ